MMGQLYTLMLLLLTPLLTLLLMLGRLYKTD